MEVMVDGYYCNTGLLPCYLLLQFLMLPLLFVSKVGDLRMSKAKQQCFVLNIKAPFC